MNLKNRVQSSFNKAFKTYDQYCSAQKIACEQAIDLLLYYGNSYSICADMGCGTGLSTQFLLENMDFKKIYAVDFSKNLVQVARQKINDGRVSYIISDFDEPIFSDRKIDLIFSNMALQWSENLMNIFSLFHSYLKNEGVLVFSVPLFETFNELKDTCRNSFFDLDAYRCFLTEAQYEIIDCREIWSKFDFPSALAALKSIKSVGANVLSSENMNHSTKHSKSSLNQFFIRRDCYQLTYHIGIFVAKKKDF